MAVETMFRNGSGQITEVSPSNPLPVSTTGGSIVIDGTSYPIKYAKIDASSSGNNTLVNAVVSKKIRVISLFLITASAVTTKIQSGAGGTDLTGAVPNAANGGFVLSANVYGWFETAANTLLNLNLGGAVNAAGSLSYIEV